MTSCDLPLAKGSTRFTTDSDGIVTSVGGDWGAFARENGADSRLAAGLGVSIWDGMAGCETRQVYRHLLARADAGAAVHFDYRCDSPDLRRELTMAIEALPDGGWSFSSAARVLVPQPGLLARLNRRVREASSARLHVCSWCNKVETPVGWFEFEEFVERAGLMRAEPLPEINHGICIECSARVLAPRDLVLA